MDESWKRELRHELEMPYMQNLKYFLEEERSKYCIYPPSGKIFTAFSLTPFQQVKVVIIGQDPYHGEGQAHGLSFSVPEGIAIPPSLKNIYKELAADVKIALPQTGCLEGWARQGVFLLNTILTVRASSPRSHYGMGWERFTDAVVEKLLQREDPMIFLLWGKAAQEKGSRIMSSKTHKVLIAAHPSPYSVQGFLGCRHFSAANRYLQEWGKTPIEWGFSSCS